MPTNHCLSNVYSSKKLLFRVIFAALSVIIMVAIFCFSAQNGTASSKTSGRVVTVVLKTFYSRFIELSANEKAQLIKTLQFLIRKCAHFSIYFLLGGSVFGFVSTFNLTKLKIVLFSWLFCVFYALTDEIHQLFSNGRSGNLRDILIDSCGSLCAILLFLLLLGLLNKKTNFKGKNMRKKVIIQQNSLLTEKLMEANKEINRLNALLAEANDKISLLEKKPEQVTAEVNSGTVETAEKTFEYNDFSGINLENAENPSIEDYAVEVIAKIVLETSKADIALSSKKDVSPDKKNLIIGFSESSKAEIFKIISEKEDFNVLKSKIDEEFAKIKKYIEQILYTVS